MSPGHLEQVITQQFMRAGRAEDERDAARARVASLEAALENIIAADNDPERHREQSLFDAIEEARGVLARESEVTQ